MSQSTGSQLQCVCAVHIITSTNCSVIAVGSACESGRDATEYLSNISQSTPTAGAAGRYMLLQYQADLMSLEHLPLIEDLEGIDLLCPLQLHHL